MLFTPDERRALLAVGGLLCLGLGVRIVSPGPIPPQGGGDSLLVVLASQAGTPPPTAQPPPGMLEEGLLRINQAGAGDLTRLPGVGPVLARRIIEDRTQHGPFRSRTDLQRVKGIGPKIAAKLVPLLSFAEDSVSVKADCTLVVQRASGPPVPP